LVRWSEVFRSGDPTELEVARALLERDDVRAWLGAGVVRVEEKNVVRASEILARWKPYRRQDADEGEGRVLRLPLPPLRAAPTLPLLTIVLLIALHAVAGSWWKDAEFSRAAALHGEVWTLLTYVFLHRDLVHLASNSGALLVLGWALVGRMGNGRAALLFVLGGVLGGALCLLRHGAHAHVGASGAIFAMLGALVALRIDDLRLGVVLLRREVLRLGGFVVLALLAGVGPSTDWLAHAGGFLAGAGLALLLRRRDATRSGVLAGALVVAGWLPVLLRAWAR
jgi:membrane associated rhomboid family serine protease